MQIAVQAVAPTKKIGYPVVLKIVSSEILHKSDIGCVKVNINSDSETKNAYAEIISKAKDAVRNPDIRESTYKKWFGVSMGSSWVA